MFVLRSAVLDDPSDPSVRYEQEVLPSIASSGHLVEAWRLEQLPEARRKALKMCLERLPVVRSTGGLSRDQPRGG